MHGLNKTQIKRTARVHDILNGKISFYVNSEKLTHQQEAALMRAYTGFSLAFKIFSLFLYFLPSSHPLAFTFCESVLSADFHANGSHYT